MTRTALRYLPLLLLAVAWEAAARLNVVDTLALPPLSHVATAWLDLIHDGELIDNGTASLYRGSDRAKSFGTEGTRKSWWPRQGATADRANRSSLSAVGDPDAYARSGDCRRRNR